MYVITMRAFICITAEKCRGRPIMAIFKTGNGESGNPGIGESDKNFIG